MKKKTFLLICFVAFLFVMIAIPETFLRLYYHEVLKTQTIPLIYQPDDFSGYTYLPGVSSEHISPSYHLAIKTNQQGFFGPDFTTEKDTAKFRIIIVSYSLASGDGYPGYLRGEFIKLSESLKRSTPDVEIINCSVDGSNMNWHHYMMIKKKLLKYKPDLIAFNTEIPFLRVDYTRECYKGYVLEYSPMSDSSRAACVEAIDRIEESKLLTALYDNSFIVRAMCKKMVDKFEYDYGSFTQRFIVPYRKRKVRAGNYKKVDYTVNETIDHLTNLSDTLKAQGTKLLLFDYFNSEASTAKEKICKANDLNYMNIEIQPKYYATELMLTYDGHPNDKGHREIAMRFYNNFIALGYIPERFLKNDAVPDASIVALASEHH